MTHVTIRRIANGWLLKTDNLSYFYDTIDKAGRAADAVAQMPSENEENSRLLREMKALSDALAMSMSVGEADGD